MLQKVLSIRTNWNRLQISSSNQLAMQILKSYDLIRVSIDNLYWSGAIFVKNEKKIPVINTAQPRANQYFTAWHEIYHLTFDQVSFGHVIEAETVMEERKAEYFASLMILGNLLSYYMDFRRWTFYQKNFIVWMLFRLRTKPSLLRCMKVQFKTEIRLLWHP